MTELKPAARERAGALSGHFRVAVWYMRVILGHFGITSGLLCGSFGYIKVVFKKHSFFQLILMILQRTRITLASIWGHLGVTLESFLAYGGALEPYLRQFDVEKHEMASVMGICAGLVGPKSENVEKVLVLTAFLKGSRRARGIQENERQSEPGLAGG